MLVRSHPTISANKMAAERVVLVQRRIPTPLGFICPLFNVFFYID